MSSDAAVQPLRISKNNTPASSPHKMANRPLAEISVGSTRRNSPSYNQATRKMIVNNREASPYNENSFTKPSLHDFWSTKDALSPSRLDVENSFTESLRSPSPGLDGSPRRRPSVERLQQASRVKNSKIFELENRAAYDPSSMPVVERPAANRPLSNNFASNFARFDSIRKENNPLSGTPPKSGHRRTESEINVPRLAGQLSSPSSVAASYTSNSPASNSPSKSSLARNSQFGLHTSGYEDSLTWSEDERCSTPRATPRATLHRNNKSVTFETDPTINEYENPTPEPSIAAESVTSREGSADSEEYYYEGDSFERGSSVEQDNSFDEDLENVDKTPVVLPEHWLAMSQADARMNLIDDEDDVFESSVIHHPSNDALRRSVSDASDGSTRPLPPLPSPMGAQLRKKDSRRVLVERAASEDIVITNLDTGETKELQVRVNEAEVHEDSVVAELEEFAASPPRISRESILRKVRGSKYDFDDEDEEEDASFADATENAHYSISELAQFGPDQPVPSREFDDNAGVVAASPLREAETFIQVKSEREDSTIDFSAVSPVKSAPNHFKPRESLRSLREDDTSVLEMSQHSPAEVKLAADGTPQPVELGETLQDSMALLTVKDYSQKLNALAEPKSLDRDFVGLPEYDAPEDWALAMNSFCGPAQEDTAGFAAPVAVNAFTPPVVLSPHGSAMERSSTPDSVIRRASDQVSEVSQEASATASVEQEMVDEAYDGTHRPVSPVIPERRATIRTGGKLKTRPSGTPADFEALLADAGDIDKHPMPAMPGAFIDSSTGPETDGSKLDLSLEIPNLDEHAASADDDMLGLDRAFDRVIEGQKKGYLTRQNTKVVVASARNFSGDSDDTIAPKSGASPAKTINSPSKADVRLPSAEQHFKAEPWNGKQRRKSMRTASAQRGEETAPPLPGQQSALTAVNEDPSLLDETDLGDNERGRLFIKVVGVSDIDMPLPRNDRVDFKLTLDNGLHCVTTGAIELDHNAAIGQEFELVVQNDLDFQLTLSTRLPPPTRAQEMTPVAPSSPTKSNKSVFSRLLSSPKKRAEQERLQREAQEADERRHKEELARKRASMQPNAFDLMRELVNSADGSFARAYVNLATYETECFGRKAEVRVPLYNEWAVEKDAAIVNSVRSKRGADCGPIRRPPYVIGQLVCQLLYIPRPKDASEEDLPKSMSSAVREMNKASEAVEVSHDGFLSQQGGDCVHWRRRFFSLQGSKLTAYHEHTHQKRAVINLAKASRLVDDRSTLVADPSGVKAKSRSRRKSAFAEEDEGYQYVEEGFRIRFANGETIDFYADSRADKDVWMQNLAHVIGKADAGSRKQKWTDLVLAREKAQGRTPQTQSVPATPITTEVRDFTQAEARPEPPAKENAARKPLPPTKSAPSSPAKRAAPTVPAAQQAKRPTTPPMQPRTGHRTRQAVKSMIF